MNLNNKKTICTKIFTNLLLMLFLKPVDNLHENKDNFLSLGLLKKRGSAAIEAHRCKSKQHLVEQIDR